jgi:hypothetical protein
MKWVIFVVMAALADQPTGTSDVYVFQKPVFETYDECTKYVMNPNNIPDLANHLIAEYGLRYINEIICAPESKVRKYILKEYEI